MSEYLGINWRFKRVTRADVEEAINLFRDKVRKKDRLPSKSWIGQTLEECFEKVLKEREAR